MNGLEPKLGDAILKLRPEARFVIREENLDTLEWADDTISIPSNDEILDAHEQLKQEYVLCDYKTKRALAYPTVIEQLDILYHQGYEGWFNTVTQVKEQYPKIKPEID